MQVQLRRIDCYRFRQRIYKPVTRGVVVEDSLAFASTPSSGPYFLLALI